MRPCLRHPESEATWSVRLRDGRTWGQGDPYPVHPAVPATSAVDLCGSCAAMAVERNWASSLTEGTAAWRTPEPAR